MIRDLVNGLKVEQTVYPQGLLADGADITGESVNIVGFRRVAFAVLVGDYTSGEAAVTLQGQDEDGDWEAIDSGDIIEDISVLADIDNDQEESVLTFGLKTGKYQALRAIVDSGTGDGILDIAIAVLKSSKYNEPV